MNTEVCVFPRISNSIYVVELSLDLDAKLVWTYKGFFKKFNFTAVLITRDCQSSLSVLISLK